jgi:hypothetical protein
MLGSIKSKVAESRTLRGEGGRGRHSFECAAKFTLIYCGKKPGLPD